MFIATLNNLGQDYFLRGTVWTLTRERATPFETMEAAEAAVEKAKKFINKTLGKKIKIMEA